MYWIHHNPWFYYRVWPKLKWVLFLLVFFVIVLIVVDAKSANIIQKQIYEVVSI